MGWRLPAFVLATGLCVAQTPPPEEAPLDLAALADEIDPGELPDLVALLPPKSLAEAQAVVEQMTAAEMAEVWAVEDGPLFDSLCLDTIARSDQFLPEPVRLVREMAACQHLEGLWSRQGRFLLTLGRGTTPVSQHLAAATRQRFLGLAARLLRQFTETPEAVEGLRRMAANDRDVARGLRIAREYVRRRGTAATRADWLLQANRCLRAGELDAAEADLARATAAAAAGEVSRRRREAAWLFGLHQRIASAREAAAGAGATGLPGQLAHLRFLLQCDHDAAVAECRRLVALQVADSQPAAILALEAMQHGDDVDERIERALTQPSVGVEAAAVWLLRTMVHTSAALKGGDAERWSIADIGSELGRRLAGNTTEAAAILRRIGETMVLPSDNTTAVLGSMATALALQKRFPESFAAYQGVLASAMVTTDLVRAREVLLQPIPPALAGIHEIASLRAKVFLLGELRAHRPPQSAEFERVLADLSAVHGDSHEADYLRGVAAWWNATLEGPGGAGDRLALRAFESARVGPADHGWWRTHAAVLVARSALLEDVDWDDASRVVHLCHGDEADPAFVPLAVQVMSLPNLDPMTLNQWSEWAHGVERPAARSVLLSATADAWSRCDDPAAARETAQQAVETLERVHPPHLPHDRGVLIESSMHWGVSFMPGGQFQPVIRAELDFWVVPRVPGLDRLRKLAEDK